MNRYPDIVPELFSRELLRWADMRKIIGICGGYATGKDQVCSDLPQHLLQTDNRSWNDVCYLSVRNFGVSMAELFLVEWRSCFFEAAMARLKALPKYVIINDIWPFLDEDQPFMIWSMLTTIAQKQGVSYVAVPIAS